MIESQKIHCNTDYQQIKHVVGYITENAEMLIAFSEQPENGTDPNRAKRDILLPALAGAFLGTNTGNAVTREYSENALRSMAEQTEITLGVVYRCLNLVDKNMAIVQENLLQV